MALDLFVDLHLGDLDVLRGQELVQELRVDQEFNRLVIRDLTLIGGRQGVAAQQAEHIGLGHLRGLIMARRRGEHVVATRDGRGTGARGGPSGGLRSRLLLSLPRGRQGHRDQGQEADTYQIEHQRLSHSVLRR